VILTRILSLLLAFATSPPVQPIDTSPVTQGQSALHTPDAIAPAILPYAACLYGARGLPLLLGRNGAHISYDKSDRDCSTARRRAKTAALKSLENKRIPDGITPTEYVENALAEIDAFVGSLTVRQRAGTSPRPPAVGIPVTIEDEVRPAYDRYEDCLKTQVSFTQTSIDTILPVFKQAMTICRGVRDSAVTDAENALAKKGWDPARSVQAAESTFAAADESWLEMGRQFRETEIARMPPSKRHR
jgi:hypothetical protein